MLVAPALATGDTDSGPRRRRNAVLISRPRGGAGDMPGDRAGALFPSPARGHP